MKRYKNYLENLKTRRDLKKQGFEKIKIKNGEVISSVKQVDFAVEVDEETAKRYEEKNGLRD